MTVSKEHARLLAHQNLIFLLDKLCRLTGITHDKIKSKSRKREILDPLKVYCKVALKKGYTLTTIGDSIYRDHATVIHSAKGFDKLVETNSEFRKEFLGVYHKLYNILKASQESINSKGNVYLHYGRGGVKNTTIQQAYELLQKFNYEVFSPFHIYGFDKDKQIIGNCLLYLINDCNMFYNLDPESITIESLVAEQLGLPQLTEEQVLKSV